MKFKIYKSALLAQLSNSQKLSLIGDFDLPDIFIFDGIPFEEGPDPIEAKYPTVRPLLTVIQWQMFRELARHPEGVSQTTLAKYCKQTDYDGHTGGEERLRNLVANYVGILRKKLPASGLSFTIEFARFAKRYRMTVAP